MAFLVSQTNQPTSPMNLDAFPMLKSLVKQGVDLNAVAASLNIKFSRPDIFNLDRKDKNFFDLSDVSSTSHSDSDESTGLSESEATFSSEDSISSPRNFTSPFAIPEDLAREIWLLIAEEFCEGASPHHLLTFSKNHPLAQVAASNLLKKLEIYRQPHPNNRTRKLKFNITKRQHFAYLSIWSRHLRKALMALQVTFSEKGVDEEVEYLTDILQLLERNGNDIQALRLTYHALPSHAVSQEFFRVIRRFRIQTIKICDEKSDHPVRPAKHGPFFSYSAFPDPEKSIDALNGFMSLISPWVTHINISYRVEPTSLTSGVSPPWPTLEYGRLTELRITGRDPYLDHLPLFLARNDALTSLTVHGPRTFGQTFSFQPHTSPLWDYCPLTLRMVDTCACSLLETYSTKPKLENLYILSTYRNPPLKHLDCLEYVSHVESLVVTPTAHWNGEYGTSFHSGAQHAHVQSLAFSRPEFECHVRPDAEALEAYLANEIQHFPSVKSIGIRWPEDCENESLRIEFSRVAQRLGWEKVGREDQRRTVKVCHGFSSGSAVNYVVGAT